MQGMNGGSRFQWQFRWAWLAAVAAVAFLGISRVRASEAPVVREVTDATARAAAEERAQQQLRLVVPEKDHATATTRMVEKQHVTWGELFEKGRTQALVELEGKESAPGMIALATWDVWKWHIEQVIELPVHRKKWLDATHASSRKEDEAVFRIFQFDASMAPSLIVSTDQQGLCIHALLLYDPTSRRLTIPGIFCSPLPEKRETCWEITRPHFDKMGSHSRAFYGIADGRLRHLGTLHEVYLGNARDLHITVPASGATNAPTVWTFRVEEEDPALYVIKDTSDRTKKAVEIGRIRFLKPQSGSHVCAGYFLEKLTSLPRTLATRRYKRDGEEIIKVPEQVPDEDVLVRGNAAVLQVFSSAKAL